MKFFCGDMNDDVLELAKKNVSDQLGQENHTTKCFVEKLEWGNENQEKHLTSTYPQTDLIIGIDIIYNASKIDILFHTVCAILENANPGALFITCMDDLFFEAQDELKKKARISGFALAYEFELKSAPNEDPKLDARRVFVFCKKKK